MVFVVKKLLCSPSRSFETPQSWTALDSATSFAALREHRRFAETEICRTFSGKRNADSFPAKSWPGQIAHPLQGPTRAADLAATALVHARSPAGTCGRLFPAQKPHFHQSPCTNQMPAMQRRVMKKRVAATASGFRRKTGGLAWVRTRVRQ